MDVVTMIHFYYHFAHFQLICNTRHFCFQFRILCNLKTNRSWLLAHYLLVFVLFALYSETENSRGRLHYQQLTSQDIYDASPIKLTQSQRKKIIVMKRVNFLSRCLHYYQVRVFTLQNYGHYVRLNFSPWRLLSGVRHTNKRASETLRAFCIISPWL